MDNRWRVIGILLPFLAGLAWGQDEQALKQYFEGRKVTVKIDLPATKDGADVDVFPTGRSTMNYRSYADRLKRFGTALRDGDTVLVSLVKVKRNMVEFQLGGGGYGTFGDDTDTSPHYTPVAKSRRERDLEIELDRETDPRQRRRIQDQLNDLRWRREREDDRRRHDAEIAAAAKADRIQDLRLQAGSRFNLHFGSRIDRSDLTPERIVQALEQFVSFPWLESPAPEPTRATLATPAADRVVLRKGMTRGEVEAMLGSPKTMAESTEGSMTLLTCTYRHGADRVEAVFCEEVLLRYTISSD